MTALRRHTRLAAVLVVVVAAAATNVALAMEGLWGIGKTYRSYGNAVAVGADGSRRIKYDHTVEERV